MFQTDINLYKTEGENMFTNKNKAYEKSKPYVLSAAVVMFLAVGFTNCGESINYNEFTDGAATSSSIGVLGALNRISCEAQTYDVNQSASEGLFSSVATHMSDGSCQISFPRGTLQFQGQDYPYYIWGNYTTAGASLAWNANQYCKEIFGSQVNASNFTQYENVNFEETYFLTYDANGVKSTFRAGSRNATLYYVISSVTCR